MKREEENKKVLQCLLKSISYNVIRLEVWMYCIATMLMENKMKIFKDVLTGCLRSKFPFFNIFNSHTKESLFLFHIIELIK